MDLNPTKTRSSDMGANLTNFLAFSDMKNLSRQKQQNLRKTSSVLRDTFHQLIRLSVKLVDANWDKTILRTCLTEDSLPSIANDEDRIAQRRHQDAKQKELLALVYDRMHKKLLRELFKGQ